ncbi:uncharacterized protein LOC110668822 [Hevea brasiliensis]|uniref:uncharacterized protein LOC110668822 n=1 Tax=Hevea brasiliensis TaxID=3981 RepID=UPI000B7997A0|nr:uncharacterized protein LOC110668822 [Hevea brasiliensis]
MPNYVKFLKEILSKKSKLKDYETVMLTEECSSIIQSKMPPKSKDPGSFTIPCNIGNVEFTKASCDLSASINLMPFSLCRKLGLSEIKSIIISLQLTNRSFTYPRGIVKDVLVKVDKFIFPEDFLVLDMKEDREVPLILGRPFLATRKALIDVPEGKLTLRVGQEEVTFNFFNDSKFPSKKDECFRIDMVDKCPREVFVEPEINLKDIFNDNSIEEN